MNRKWIQSAVALVLATTGVAIAQTRVDHSGANDANNRVGSGGRNIPREQPRPWQLSNDIVYGNVTGGKEFRGPLGSTDPSAFRGSTGSRTSDNFIRDSAGVSTGGVTSYNTSRTQPFYGDSRAVAPPPGFQQIPGAGGYIPPKPPTTHTIDPTVGPLSSEIRFTFRPDQFGMAGPVDLQYSPNAIAVPSIVQARQLDPSQLSDYTQLNRNTENNLTNQQLDELRKNLNLPQANPTNNGATSTGGATMGGAQSDQIQAPTISDQLQDGVESKTLGSAIDAANAPELGSRSFVPGASSSTYAQLAARRGEQDKMRPGQANEVAAKQFNDQLKERAEAEAAKKNADQPAPANANENKEGAAAPAAGDDKAPNIGANRPGPLKVDTLADNKAGGLNDVLKKAEGQLREGKYGSAIESYEAAEKVAPNNPLVKLGKAHAELGGGYYRRAEVNLRRTLAADKNLLAGQYDLRGFLGDERLKTIEQDLRDLIQKNDKDTGSAVLLAYVYYNTANERRAAALLDLAEKRAAGKDPFVSLLKQNWSLPPVDGTELNK